MVLANQLREQLIIHSVKLIKINKTHTMGCYEQQWG